MECSTNVFIDVN